MKYFLIVVIAFLCLLSVGVSHVVAVNSPQCLLQDQSQMDTCDNVNTEILGFSIPTLGNVLTFLLRGMLIASGLAGFFFLLTGALMYQRGDAESKDLALLRIRASVIGILLTVTVIALVWTLEQVIFKRRVCLGLSCPIILQSVLSTTDSLDCCVCLITSGPKAGQVGEVINRYEQTCTVDGIGVDLKTAVRDAQIQKIVDDMTLLRGQLLTWKSSFSGDFPHENVFKNVIGYTNQDAPCHDDPLFSEILKHDSVNRSMASYMPSPPQDPWGSGICV